MANDKGVVPFDLDRITSLEFGGGRATIASLLGGDQAGIKLDVRNSSGTLKVSYFGNRTIEIKNDELLERLQ